MNEEQLDELLSQPRTKALEWSEPRAATDADGNPAGVSVRVRADVADCIAMQRASRHGWDAHLTERELLQVFIECHYKLTVHDC